MRIVSLSLLAVAAGLALAAPRAEAADVSDEGATALEQTLHDWLAGLVGPSLPLGDRPVHVAASDDHYAVEIPIAGDIGESGVSIDADDVKAAVRPLGGGRWAIDKLAWPSPLILTHPAPGGTGQVKSTLTIESQDQRGVLDPSLATVSTFDTTSTGYQSVQHLPSGTQRTRVERMVSHLTLRPAGKGLVDVLGENESTLVTANGSTKEAGAVSFSAAKLRATLHVDGFAPAQAAPIVRAAAELAPLALGAMRAAAERKRDGTEQAAALPSLDAASKKAAKAAVRSIVLALQSLGRGIDEQYTVEDVHMQSAMFSGHLDKFASGMALAAHDGVLHARMHFVVDGLSTPSVPEGVYRDYMPRHIAFTPKLGGLPTDKVSALLLRAVDSEGPDPALEKQAEALLFGGAVVAGLDDLALDFGPATLKGKGEVHVLGRDRYSGDAHLVATGLDALIRRANTVPELKQAAPFLIFLKGIGQQDGDSVVWDISYANKTLLVNGADVSGMMPGK